MSKNIIETILIPIVTIVIIFTYFVTKFSLITRIFVTIFVFVLLQIQLILCYKKLNKDNYDI